MKQLLYLSLVLMLSLVSCTNSEEEEQRYSCNEEANLWVKKNLREIRTLTRSEWLDIPNQNYQRAAYIAFKPKQKLDFWLEKFEDVLQLNWNAAERQHIKAIHDFLRENPYVFQDECSDEEQRQFDLFIYEWSDMAIKELNWSQELVASLIATGYPMIDIQGSVQMPKQVNTLQARSECDCHRGNVAFIWCGGSTLSSYCAQSSCSGSSKGCGALWQESCDGACE